MRNHDSLRIFVGYDEREACAYHTCVQSIIENCSRPVSVTPLALNHLAHVYAERHEDGSNAFIYSRFLVPWLCGFSGHALYLDGDMIVRGDLVELFALARIDMGVQVVMHDYKTSHPVKYLGSKNENYPMKNWSSVCLWNCSFHPNRKLTPEFVASKTGTFLHRFLWLDDVRIGELPAEWNHLCMEYAPNPDAKLLHMTLGIPAFEGYEQQEGADEWWGTLGRAMYPVEVSKCSKR